jgi:hypothetical protein
MANLIADIGVTGLDAYGVLYDLDANTVFNRNLDAWEAFNAANWDDYDWPMTEQGSTGRYVSDDPLPTLTPPLLDVVIRNRTDVAPDPDVSVDPQFGSGWCGWLGTKFAGEGNVRLADAVAHGGSTARIRLGQSGAEVPLDIRATTGNAVYVENQLGNAISLSAAQGYGLDTTGTVRFSKGMTITTTSGVGLTVSATSGVGMLISSTSNTGLAVTSTTGRGIDVSAGGADGIRVVGATNDINADITGDLAGKVLGGGSGTITGIGASTQLAAGVLHGGPSTQLELQSSGFTPACYIHTDESPAVPALHVEYAGTTAGMTGSAFRISANAAAVGLYVSGGTEGISVTGATNGVTMVGGTADLNADITGNLSGLDSGVLSAIATAFLDLANGIEAGITPRQALRAMAAALAGDVDGSGTLYRAIGNTDTNRLTVTDGGNGERTVAPTL